MIKDNIVQRSDIEAHIVKEDGILKGLEVYYENGLQIALLPTNSKIVNGTLSVRSGLVDEPPEKNGLRHLAEHAQVEYATSLMKKRTSKEKVFSIRSGITGYTETTYSFNSKPEGISELLSVLLDAVYNTSHFENISLEKYIWEILGEMTVNHSEQHFQDWVTYRKTLFPNDRLVCRLIGGDPDYLRTVTNDDLILLWKKEYGLKNSRMILIGQIPDDIKSVIRDKISGIPVGETLKTEVLPPCSLEESVSLHIPAPYFRWKDYPNLSDCMINFGVQVPPYESQEYDLVKILTHLMQTNAYPSLWNQLSEEAFVYPGNFSVSYHGWPQRGALEIEISMPWCKHGKAKEILIQSVEELKKSKIPNDVISSITEEALYHHVVLTNDPKYTPAIVKDYLLYRRTPKKRIDSYKSVTHERIQEVANSYLSPYVIALRDPLYDGPATKTIAGVTTNI